MKAKNALITTEEPKFCFACGNEYKKFGRIGKVSEYHSTYECRCGASMETLRRDHPDGQER